VARPISVNARLPRHTPSARPQAYDQGTQRKPKWQIRDRPLKHQGTRGELGAVCSCRASLVKQWAACREKPHFAREREIESGRYSPFSPEERAQLRSLVQ
jgi:hypothetical protein